MSPLTAKNSTRALAILLLLTASAFVIPMQAQTAPQVFKACYNGSGSVYLIKMVGLKDKCSGNHVEFEWTVGVAGHKHGSLNGLDADDHLQYLLVSGARALAGDLNAGGNKINNLAPAAAAGEAVSFEQVVLDGDSAAGDLGGIYPNPTVSGLMGNPLGTVAPTDGQLLGWNGADGEWQAMNPATTIDDHGNLVGLADDDHPQYLLTDGTRPLTGSLGAGGNKITGLGTASAAGDAVTYEQAVLDGDSASGDLSDLFPAPIVVGLQGNSVASTAPADGQLLGWSAGSAEWQPVDPQMAASDHGLLGGLADDDHPQYLVEGLRNWTDGFAVSGAVGSGGLAASGAGTRLLWYPRRAALRAGTVTGDAWDDANVARQSVAFGRDTRAEARRSFAAGDAAKAEGEAAVAMGIGSTASGLASIALGNGSTAGGDNSTALGFSTVASGELSTAIGDRTEASGAQATAMGNSTEAIGGTSTAIGFSTKAEGFISVAMGDRAEATGARSTAMGNSTKAVGGTSTAMGFSTAAEGQFSTAMGNSTKAVGGTSTAMGFSTTAEGQFSTAIGHRSHASGQWSIAMGDASVASGERSTAMGNGTLASGNAATAMGRGTQARGNASVATGGETVTEGSFSTAMGQETSAIGHWSISGGWRSSANGGYSVAIGSNVTADSTGSVAMGTGTTASGSNAVALGLGTTASGIVSMASGSGSIASGGASRAMGFQTTASGLRSMAMGTTTRAEGDNSLAIGFSTTAGGNNSLAMGRETSATGPNSLATGFDTEAGSNAVALGTNAGAATGSFAFGDATPGASRLDPQANSFRVRARVTEFYSSPVLITGVRLNPGAGSWSTISDRNLKENFRQEDSEHVLSAIAEMDIPSWNYKTQDQNIRHVGPMAQDFRAAFQLGSDDRHITTTDIDGINMLAIQGLEKRTRELQAENEALRAVVEELLMPLVNGTGLALKTKIRTIQR